MEHAPEKLAVGRRELAGMLSIGVRSLDRMNSAGLLGPRPRRLGGRLLWSVEEIREWLASACQRGEWPTRAEWLAHQRTTAR